MRGRLVNLCVFSYESGRGLFLGKKHGILKQRKAYDHEKRKGAEI